MTGTLTLNSKDIDPGTIASDVVTCSRWECPDGAAKPMTPRPDPLLPGLTVAVCTYRRADALRRFLDSLTLQEMLPDCLMIVDASPDDDTERMFKEYPKLDRLGGNLTYFRVTGSLRGLTRQRNLALRWVTTDLVAFFDDDIVLLPHCLEEMARGHRELGDRAMGVAAFITNEDSVVDLFWRLRVLLRIVPQLQPGGYARSGFSIPWRFLGPCESLVKGTWLQGGASMWKTARAREIGFNERFSGYANGEDLDFSLRIGEFGDLMLNGKARLMHLPDVSGRPNAYLMGYGGIRNAYAIHYHCLPGRTWRDAVRFVYGYGLDALMRIGNLLMPGPTRQRWHFLRGRMRFFFELLTGRLEA